jgi:hypothetical protein
MNATFKAPGVRVVAMSSNKKLGMMHATYVAQPSCPRSCPLLGAGCYAEKSWGPSLTTRRINEEAEGLSPQELAEYEAKGIDFLTDLGLWADLRLHVVGDCRIGAAARTVSQAADRYIAASRRRVYTYTHAWEKVDRESWGGVSVLASCHTVAQAKKAMDRGYAVAMVVPPHPQEQTYTVNDGRDRLSVIPCPYETRGVACSQCGLCQDGDKLLNHRLAIGFQAKHGAKVSSRISLEVVRT